MSVYYNEIDGAKAAWLRELIGRNLIAPGDVDERSITNVCGDDLRGYAQCHWFAGIGAWSYALRLARWPDDRPVWTGSCPCPSFSAAGKGEGFADPRHLWPAWARLIRECRPATIFGEQVDAAIGHGWLDLVQSDLEAEEYAVGKAVLGACSVGAPHIRKRLYFVADVQDFTRRRAGDARDRRRRLAEVGGPGALDLVADAADGGRQSQPDFSGGNAPRVRAEGALIESCDDRAESGILAHTNISGSHGGPRGGEQSLCDEGCRLGGMADAERREEHEEQQRPSADEGGRSPNLFGRRSMAHADGNPDPHTLLWRDCDWILCRDGKWRPVEAGTFPLATGSPARMVRLRGYGDAIIPQVAQAFIESYLATES